VIDEFKFLSLTSAITGAAYAVVPLDLESPRAGLLSAHCKKFTITSAPPATLSPA
jgi:hypothetical protein